MRKISTVFFSLVCLFPFLIDAQTPTPSATPELPINEADLIHFGDVIDVDFGGGTEYDWRGTLNSEGLLDGLNEMSTFPALCRAERNVAADIARVYSKILRDPKVTVKVIDRSNRAVARLDGAIRTPMRFRIQRVVRLRELIVAAGGLTDYASGEIVIIRASNLNCPRGAVSGPSGNGLQTINISVSELLSGKETADPVILSGDIVTVEKAFPIYLIGAVNNPRPIFSHSGMTLTRAIDTAGGLAKGAVEPKITIFRRERAETTIIRADFEKIKKGEIVDVDLRPFDIIEVTSKGRAPRKYPPVIASGDNGGGNAADLPLRIIE